MRLVHILLSVGLAASRVIPRREQSGCSNPVKRVDFLTLNDAARKQYTNAVECLATKPSMIGLNATLYDDFAYVHAQLGSTVHMVAQFLPWHRYFVHLYETQLNACGYTGPMVYWDWTLDTANMSSSAIFSANAFGGNGGPRTETTNDTDNRTWKCVADRPFEKLRPAYVSTKYAPHCLSRDVDFTSTKFRNDYTAASIAGILASDTFGYFATSLESNPHNQIYMDLGGDMDEDSSPNDPLFFLHHVQVDRLWWLWQQEKPGTRNREYNGIREMTVDEDGWPTFEGPDAKL